MRAKVRSVLLALGAVILVGTILLMASAAGPLCGTILVILFMAPAHLGVACGSAFRARLKNSSTFEQRWYLPIVLFLLVPALVHLAERGAALRHAPESLATSRTLPVSVARSWNARIFAAGGNRGGAPRSRDALQLPSPMPQSMTGDRSVVGGVKKITFDRGARAGGRAGRARPRSPFPKISEKFPIAAGAQLLEDRRGDRGHRLIGAAALTVVAPEPSAIRFATIISPS